MDREAFERALARDGFEIVSRTMEPDSINPEHVHPFEARLLMLEGTMTVARDGEGALTYRPGDIFEVRRGCRHSETAGPAGATYVAGRLFPERKAMS